jgi:hypothetical protein
MQKHNFIDCRYGCLQIVEQSGIVVLLSNCVIGVDCSRRSADLTAITKSYRTNL